MMTEDSSDKNATDERTPLLGAVASNGSANGVIKPDGQHGHPPNGSKPSPASRRDAGSSPPADGESEPDEPAMPFVQILLLCIVSLAEPMAYFGIVPFINEMIERTGGIPESSVGFWVGLIESLFSLVQMALAIVYGRLADRWGRKPILVFSLFGMGIMAALFGFSRSLWQMLLLRCLGGVFGGSAVTIRTMISENCSRTTAGRAFSYFMFTRNLGILLGPLIGGGLANPAEQFPKAFEAAFWSKYPYALATSVLGLFIIITAITSALFIKETLKRSTAGEAGSEPPMSTWQVLKSPGVPIVLAIFGYVMMMSLIFTAVSPVFWFTSIEKGGLAFSDQLIAAFLALIGATQAAWMLIAFPPLQRRFGTGPLLRALSVAFPTLMVMYPVFNEFLRHDLVTVFWAVAPVVVSLGSGVAMSFTCIQLLVNDISPSNQVLGTMNALALTVNNAVRAFAPIVGTSIYAAGVKWGFADGHLIFIVLFVLGIGLNVLVQFVPPAAEGKVPQKKTTAADEESATETVHEDHEHEQ